MSCSSSSTPASTPGAVASDSSEGSGGANVLHLIYKQLADIDTKLTDVLQRLNDIDSDDEELALSEVEPSHGRPGYQSSFGYSLARKPVSNFSGYRNNPFSDRFGYLKRSRTDFGPNPSFGPMSGPFTSPFKQ